MARSMFFPPRGAGRYGRRVMSAAEVLVGRDAELRALERALEALDGGEPRALGLVGEPGIGKSRLLGELGRRAACRGHVVLAGRASELERDVPFALWVDAAMRQPLDSLPEIGSRA